MLPSASILLQYKKESFWLFAFYGIVFISSIVGLGVISQIGFLIALLGCALSSPRAGAIALLSFFYLPISALRIPSVFLMASFIVALVNLKTVVSVFKNPIVKWLITGYIFFLLARFISIVFVENSALFSNYLLTSFSVIVHIIIFGSLIQTKEDVDYILKWWGLIGVFATILGFMHFYLGDSVYLRSIVSDDTMDKGTIEGVMESVRWIWVGVEPNFWGLSLLFPFSINLGFLFQKVNIHNIVTTAIVFLGILGSYSRTSFLIAILLIVLYLFYTNNRYKYAVFCLIPIAFLLVSQYFPEFIERIGSIDAALNENKGSGRFPLYMEAIDNFLSSPILGIGTGQTPYLSKFKLETHNLFLQTLGENGILGFITLMFIFIRAFKKAYSIRLINPMYFICLLGIIANANTVSAFDMRCIMSFIIIISYFHYFVSLKQQ